MSNEQHREEDIAADASGNLPAPSDAGQEDARPHIELTATIGTQRGELNMLKNPTWNAGRDNIIQIVIQQYVSNGSAPPTKEALEQAQTEYLDYVATMSAPLDWKGFTADRTPGETPLDCLYVTLTAEHEVEPAPPGLPEDALPFGGPGQDKPDADRAAQGRQHQKRIEKAELYQVLTRHNRLVILGDPGAGKTTLTRFLALRFAEACQQNQEEVVDREGNSFGPTLLPVRVALSDFVKQWDSPSRLDSPPDFYSVLASCAHPRLNDNPAITVLLKTTLENGAGLILLDGLDEISDPDTRRHIARELTQLARIRTNKNRMLVTSRIAGYWETAGISGFTPYTLSELPIELQKRFITRWYAHYEPQRPNEIDESGRSKRAGEKAQRLIENIEDKPSVGRFAANPLMLTLLCMTAAPDKPLPVNRVELYARFSHTLLRGWQKGKPDAENRSITEWEEKFLLPPLAYEMQEKNTNGKISKADVLKLLHHILSEHREQTKADEVIWRDAEAFWKRLVEHTGLSAEYSSSQYGFIHLTFQEYYAARHLANKLANKVDLAKVEWVKTQIFTYRTQARWEEVIRLTIALQEPKVAAYLIRNAIMPQGLWNWIRGFRRSKYDRYLRRDLLLSARCLSDCANIEPILAREVAGELVAICLRKGKFVYTPLIEHARHTLGAVRGCEIGVRAVPALLTALKNKDKDRNVRNAAAYALGALGQGSKEVVQGLLTALKNKDEDRSVRNTAAYALGALGQGSKEVVQALLTALEDKNDLMVRYAAVRALGALGQGSKEVVPELLTALKDKNDLMVRNAAARALGALGQGSKEVVQALLTALKDEDRSVRDAAWNALWTLVQ